MQDVEADKRLLLRVLSGAPRVPGQVVRSLGLHLPSLPAAQALLHAQPPGHCPRQVSSGAPFVPNGNSKVTMYISGVFSRNQQISSSSNSIYSSICDCEPVRFPGTGDPCGLKQQRSLGTWLSRPQNSKTVCHCRTAPWVRRTYSPSASGICIALPLVAIKW